MPPPGGTRSQIQVSYNWGNAGSMSGSQDIAARFRDVFQGNSALFSPNYPMVPPTPELARLWDYPVGYNYIYTPRSYEPVTFEELRALASNEALTRLAIETRKDQVEKLEWEIRPREEKEARKLKQGKGDDSTIKKLTEFWRHPDGRPFGAWLRESMEDLLVIDAPTFEILRNRDGSIRGFDVIDGSTIKLLIDITGRLPEPPAPAYLQVIHGRPWRLFSKNELLYLPRNKRPGHRYGYAPVEQILMFINIALRRQITQLNWFTESNIPKGIINTPDGWGAQQMADAQQWFDAVAAGNLAERSKAIWAPYGSKYQAIKEAPLKDEFDEWLARVVMFCFSLPPDAFVRMRNRSTSETAAQTAKEEGLAPLMLWIKRLADGVIQSKPSMGMGHADLEFAWQEIKETDPEVQEKVITSYVKTGIYTPNEAREELGKEEIEGGDQALLIAGATIMLLKDVEQVSDNQANPPPFTPFGGSPMGGAGRAGKPNGENSHNGVGRGANPAGGPPGRGSRGAPAANNGSGVGKAAANTFPDDQESATAGSEIDGSDREALAHEAREIFRRARARRVEADRETVGP